MENPDLTQLRGHVVDRRWNPVPPRRALLKFFGTFGRLLSYSDKRMPWVKDVLIFCVELLTSWC